MATVSSHTLNGSDGTHAGGIKVTLVNLDCEEQVFVSETDEGGRLSEEVDLSAFNATDRYELTMHTSDYWRNRGVAHNQIIEELVLRFKMPDPAARYHMPFILSPNSYSVWASVPEASG